MEPFDEDGFVDGLNLKDRSHEQHHLSGWTGGGCAGSAGVFRAPVTGLAALLTPAG
jgi:hypothetical protein